MLLIVWLRLPVYFMTDAGCVLNSRRTRNQSPAGGRGIDSCEFAVLCCDGRSVLRGESAADCHFILHGVHHDAASLFWERAHNAVQFFGELALAAQARPATNSCV